MQIWLAITAVIPIYVGLVPFITITFCMVHPRGFEPLTARFVAGYSIQLSYGCKSNTCVSYLSKSTLAKTSAFSIAAAGWNGASERIRTSDRSVRSRVLYPAELRMQIWLAITAVIPIYVGLVPFITITFCMVHPRGFEPLTARFVAGYSIQLSYGCIEYFINNMKQGAWITPHGHHKTKDGASERIRTSDRSVRSRVLYPAELRMHRAFVNDGGERGIRTLDRVSPIHP